MKHTVCALVLGGNVNGYSIIRELSECGVKNICLFDYRKSLSSKSNKITDFSLIEKNSISMKEQIQKLHQCFEYIVLYPTDDLQLELLSEIYDDIADFCFIPFNCENLSSSLNKSYQYSMCEKLGIPFPKTQSIHSCSDLRKIEKLTFPLIVKPNKRDDLRIDVFRNLYIKDRTSFLSKIAELKVYLDRQISFLVSEYVPGDDTNIYAYTGYRSPNGEILNEWTGKKLTQFPDLFGVFSSASNEAPEVVRQQGRALLDGLDIVGIAEPEFKYDSRDGEYKLMEVNLRSMMWHRVGNLSGVYLQYSQWLDATGQKVPRQHQRKDVTIHFVCLKHEIINLFSRRGYWPHFKHAVFSKEKRHYAEYDPKDIKPFLHNLKSFPKGLVGRWLKILLTH